MENKKMTNEEFKALDEKAEHPEKEVKCPRCGNLLEFTDYGCGYHVFCKTEGCIEERVRGI